MFCSKCGAENPDQADFCRACGQALEPAPLAPGAAGASGDMLQYGYAGFWERFAALIIDGFILNLMSIPVVIVGVVATMAMDDSSGSDAITAIYYLVYYLGFYAISAIYFVSMESGEKGATFGKRILKMRVVDVEGRRISVGRALGRWASHALSYLTLYIGFLIQPFTARKQALHDMVAGTIVVRTEKNSNNAAVAIIVAVVALFFVVFVIGILAAIAIPAYQDYVAKAKVYRAVDEGRQAANAVESYYARNGRLPGTLSETDAHIPPGPDISEIVVDPDTGEVRLIFSTATPSSLAGKYLSMMPSKAEDGSISWKCSSDVRPSFLPAQCK